MAEQKYTTEMLDKMRKESPRRYYMLLGRGEFQRVYCGPKAKDVFTPEEMVIAEAINEIVRYTIIHSSNPKAMKEGMLMCATLDEMAGDNAMVMEVKARARGLTIDLEEIE